MVERADAVVIGAGVVGLAVARALAQAGREVIVVEQADSIGTETSSRNSEVIHAGIYYPQGSLKALTCVEGRTRLYAYCAERGIPHKRLGKLIVACDEAQLTGLAGLKRKAEANGVDDLVWLDSSQAKRLEPALACVGALLSPSTGIIDSHAYMLALQGDAEAAGTMIAFNTPVLAATIGNDGIALETGGDQPLRLLARTVINSAGLHAPALAGKFRGLPESAVPPGHFAKGNYYTLAGRSPFSRLIYPAPVAAGLGVHITVDLAGQARFGPDVEWIETIDYTVDPSRAQSFYTAIRTYWPGLPDGALQPGYAGIRPKLQAPGEPAKDFVIQGPADHGIRGLVNLFGIESPGLTASLAIADRAAALCVP
ncbi:MAG: NAD(P)/FAD-dependent oxidoreductase [Alphaproteobacteria bacterium]|nr:NAD(P)/FAD-dependent oxidoreductase [Alphaproteobacteria bacterium]